MTQQKAKPAASKVPAAKVGSKAVANPKTIKVTSTAATTKKAAVAKPIKTKVTVAKKAVTTTAKKTVAASKSTVVKKPHANKAKSATARTVGPKKVAKITPEERYRMVETTAYFIAEKHGFQGRSDEHWAAAEIEVAARLGQ
jgi:hypothetical protein